MSRRALRAAVAALPLLLLLPAAAPVGSASTPAWPAWPSPAGTAGVARVVDGVWGVPAGVHRGTGADADGLGTEDYFAALLTGGELPADERDDAYRAVTHGAFGLERSAHEGDYLLPTDAATWPDFTGELAWLGATVDGDDLVVRFRFTSLPRPDAQVATLRLVSVGDPLADVATPWPRDAGVTGPGTHTLTTWGTGAALATPAGESDVVADLGGAVRVDGRAVDVRLPLASLPAGPWRVWAGSGLADPADPTRYWAVPAGEPTATTPGTGADTAPGSNVWKLAFAPEAQGLEQALLFHERVQADLLAAGDVTPASTVLDPALLVPGSDVAPDEPVGALVRTHLSALDLGDGITRSPGASPRPPAFLPSEVRLRDPGVDYTYLGDLQPHWLYVPASYDPAEPTPLVVYLHGLNNNLDEPWGNVLGLVDELEARGWLGVSLLGRGDLFYRGPGELDVLEAIESVATDFAVDRSRVLLFGHSMGGFGTHNVATRHPDRFAAVNPNQGIDSTDLLGNLRNVPWRMTTSLQDLDAGGIEAGEGYDALSALGYDARLVTYTRKIHEYSSVYDHLGVAFETLAAARVPSDPAEVRYRIRGGDDAGGLAAPGAPTAALLARDGAYWVSGLAPADPAVDAEVVAATRAEGLALLDPTAAVRTTEPDPDLGVSGRAEGIVERTVPFADGAPPAVASEPEVALDLTNLAAATVDLASAAGEVAVERVVVTTDVPVRLALAGVGLRDGGSLGRVDVLRAAAPGAGDGGVEAAATTDAEPVAEDVAPGATVRVEVPAGAHVITIVAAGAGPAGAAPDVKTGRLPDTGGGAALAGLLALFGAAALGRGRR
ncbi:MAG: prolyl oligopeptidase family serine peptidase [Actinomycetes bacterium]